MLAVRKSCLSFKINGLALILNQIKVTYLFAARGIQE